MLHKINGKTIAPIGLGCMSLSHAYGTPPDRKTGGKLLHQALDLGYNHLDTARIYGQGANEALIGETLAGRRDAFLLASKCGIIIEGQARRIDCRPETIVKALEISLSLLKTDHIDLYYLHRLDAQVPIEDSVGALARAVEQGKIGAIGLSEMSASTIQRAAKIHPIAAVQTEYSMWTRNPEIAVLEVCKALNITFVAFSPLSRGAFSDSLNNPSLLPTDDLRLGLPRFQADAWPDNHIAIVALRKLATSIGLTTAQLALAWVLSQGDYVVAIPGTANSIHLAENIAQQDMHLSSAVLENIQSILDAHPVRGHRYASAMQRSIDTEEFA